MEKKRTILVVDDSPVIRSVVKIYLEPHGYELVEAGDAGRGLQLVRLVAVDLVIADINMPGMSGLAFLKAMRSDADERVRRLPCILLTGDRSPGLGERAKDAGASAFLKKPVSSAGLLEALGDLLPEGAGAG